MTYDNKGPPERILPSGDAVRDTDVNDAAYPRISKLIDNGSQSSQRHPFYNTIVFICIIVTFMLPLK